MTFLLSRSFFYVDDFLGPRELSDLTSALDSLPVVTPEERADAESLVLAPPIFDGAHVQGRLEGAAGWPIWRDGSPFVGPALPHFLALLADDVLSRLDGERFWAAAGVRRRPFTSVYVDRYPKDGHFVPHTDRSCYDAVVAGVSGGVGTCRLMFTEPGGQEHSFTLRPGSLYAFTGPLRQEPWTHEVDRVDGVRYAVSMRAAAPDLDQPEDAR